MYFITLESADRELLMKIATETGVPLERIVRVVFLKGLQVVLTPVSPERARRRPKEELEDYIRLNWQSETDTEMAEALGYSSSYITNIRTNIGLHIPDDSQATSRRMAIDDLILKHYKSKSDAEIGKMLTPAVSRRLVCTRRLNLKLTRSRGKVAHDTLLAKIDRDGLERMLQNEGYTLTEYIQAQGLHCSKQRLSQIAEELEIKCSAHDRTPEWWINRRARALGKPELANREWFAEKLENSESVSAFAAKIGLDHCNASLFIRRHGLRHPSLDRRKSHDVNQVVCAECAKPFSRLAKLVRNKHGAVSKDQKYYCSKDCYMMAQIKRRKAR